MTKAIQAPTRGRPAAFGDNKAIGRTLRAYREGADLSRFLKLQLTKKGYMEAVQAEPNGRGRPAINYELTKSGKALANLAKNW